MTLIIGAESRTVKINRNIPLTFLNFLNPIFQGQKIRVTPMLSNHERYLITFIHISQVGF